MSKTRLERWSEPMEITYALPLPGDDQAVEMIHKARARRTDREPFTIGTMVRSARELIFDSSGEQPIFHIIAHFLHTDTFRLVVESGFQLSYTPEADKSVEEHVVYILGLAAVYDVPVYPNREEDAPILARYFRDLLTEGMLAPDETGKQVRLVLVDSPRQRITNFEYLEEIKHIETHYPAELILIREAVREELAKRDEAGRVLSMLRLAITELRDLLGSAERNEHALQRCLERNPILFGPDYERIIPKHRLGAEYEMDYALIRTSGLVDLAEIESSTLRLFKRNGDPTSDLIHAEQQVLNWLEWIERNHAYAREQLPNLVQPTGYVIIGRDSDLTKTHRRSLHRRNTIFGGQLQILTYDDLLQRAANLLRLLEGSPR